MKALVRRGVTALLRLLDSVIQIILNVWPGVAAEWNDRALVRLRGIEQEVHHDGLHGQVHLVLHTPNEVTRYRAQTFSTKEPETLDWIDRYGGDGTLYDIGANVGLYSLYHAKVHPGPVYAFEPSTLNLGLLTSNISRNGFSSKVVVFPIPISDHNQVATFHMSMQDEGGAMSTFGHSHGHDGEPLSSELEYRMPGFSLDYMWEQGLLESPPALIKIDVDGIEHLILRGAKNLLNLPSLQTVLIEVNDSFTALAGEVSQLLTGARFERVARRQSSMFESGIFSNTYNQIWLRS